jgi:hypothetical protein
MNRNTNILSPDRPPRVTPSPRSLSLTAPAVTTQRVAQQAYETAFGLDVRTRLLEFEIRLEQHP